MATVKQAGYIPFETRRHIMQHLWTTSPRRKMDQHNHLGATLFATICNACGQRLADFSHCRWSDFTIHYSEEYDKRILVIEPQTSKTNPDGTRNAPMKIVAVEQLDKYICPIYAFEIMREKMDTSSFGLVNLLKV